MALAFAMLTWHVVWSSQHGKELVQQAKQMGQSARNGRTTMMAIMIAVAMMVLREGSETVLFVHGALAANTPVQTMTEVQATPANPSLPNQLDLTATGSAPTANADAGALPTTLDLTASVPAPASAPAPTSEPLPTTLDLTASATAPAASAPTSSVEPTPIQATLPESTALSAPPASPVNTTDIWLGGAVGLLLGALVGVLLYLGLNRIPVSQIFNVTNVLVILLASGMASQLGNRLVQMGLLPSGTTPLWDSSAWLGNDSVAGEFLHALMGYDAQPSQTQVLFFVLGMLLILSALAWVRVRQRPALAQLS